MKIRKGIISVLALAAVVACNPLKQLQSHQTSLEEAYDAGNHRDVLVAFDELESYHSQEGGEIETDYIEMAAKSAYELENYQRAEDLIREWIDETGNFEAIELLGSLYRETGDSDREYEHWEQYWNEIESEDMKEEIGSRLFSLEIEKENYEKALDRFNKMPPASEPDILFMRVEALEETGKEDEAKKACDQLLEEHPDYEPAIAWQATNIYERAEKLYEEEMRKYEEKDESEEYTAYAYLRRELKKVSKMYRDSRDMFEKLHENNPDKTEYIKYLKNIYLRLEMREEATKMDMLLKDKQK
ncbi:MAG: hypothetical protein R6U46_01535 [Marinilabilia sp.]